MALTRKSMRLWGPLRLWVSLCAAVDAARRARASSSKSVLDAVPGGATAINVQEGEKCGSHDNGNDASPSYWRHVLTAIAMSQDLVYHSLDHLALLERVQFLRLTPDRADLLDRFIEQQVLSNLFKLALLDLPCVYFVLRSIGFRQSRKNQAWQGFLGMVASAISCFFQWRVATGRDLLLDYRQENAVPQKKQGHKADAHDEDAAGKHRRSPKSGVDCFDTIGIALG
eukprot:g7776.t1